MTTAECGDNRVVYFEMFVLFEVLIYTKNKNGHVN